jgi:hypothetical protein
MTDEGKSIAVPTELEFSSVETNTANMSLVDAKDTIEGSKSSESTKERPAGALLSKFRHLSVSPRPRDSTPPAHRNSPGGASAVSTTPDSTSSQQQLHSISPRGLAGIPTAQERTTPEAGSPSTSQVSIGSVPPSLAASLLPGSTPRHYDLTPVTRNTSELLAHQYVDASNPIDDGYGNLVSPEDQDVLFGEHLTFPADLSGPDTTGTGPSIPKLRSAQRAQSVGSLDQNTILKASAGQAPLGELHEDCAIPDPVQFPARKFYSFTSRQQYDQVTQGQMGDDDSVEGHVGLEPYQPSRDDDFGGVGGVPEEELRGIFIERRRGTNGSGAGGESHANHRLLNPIPMDERQWSIPSIHMAQSLQGTMTSQSYTENTDYEDDESLLYIRGDDDASLSSRCSSLYLPDETAGEPLGSALPMPSNRSAFPRHILQPQVVMNPQVLMEHSAQRDQAEDNDLDLTGHADGGLAVDRRKRKQRKREERAFEWLQSVQGNGDVLAEAASSKFLTGNRRPAVAKGEGNEFAPANLSAYGVPDPQVPAASRKTATPDMLRRQASSRSMASENAARSY